MITAQSLVITLRAPCAPYKLEGAESHGRTQVESGWGAGVMLARVGPMDAAGLAGSVVEGHADAAMEALQPLSIATETTDGLVPQLDYENACHEECVHEYCGGSTPAVICSGQGGGGAGCSSCGFCQGPSAPGG